MLVLDLFKCISGLIVNQAHFLFAYPSSLCVSKIRIFRGLLHRIVSLVLLKSQELKVSGVDFFNLESCIRLLADIACRNERVPEKVIPLLNYCDLYKLRC